MTTTKIRDLPFSFYYHCDFDGATAIGACRWKGEIFVTCGDLLNLPPERLFKRVLRLLDNEWIIRYCNHSDEYEYYIIADSVFKEAYTKYELNFAYCPTWDNLFLSKYE